VLCLILNINKAYKRQTDHGGELNLGTYVSGEGDFNTGDPMEFSGGNDTNCGTVERASEAYWYCWYDTYDEIVALDFTYVFPEVLVFMVCMLSLGLFLVTLTLVI
jgi:hypothetical protein